MASRPSARQGVVLLLVLSMLVLFVLLALTFLIGATRYRQGAEAFSQREVLGDSPSKLTDMALFDLLREPANPYSSLYGHSLLLDLYGADGMGGAVASAYTVAAPSNNDPGTGEIIRLDVPANQFNTAVFGNPSNYEDYYAGSVFSFLNGPAARESSRVVRYTPPGFDNMGNAIAARFYVEGFFTAANTIRAFINSNPNQVLFLVNGKPFNGAGVGYSVQHGGSWDPMITFSPHYAHYQTTAPVWSLPVGQANESYDALDHLNMFLAKNPPSATGVVASFHRPRLIDYVATNAAAQWSTVGASQDFYRTFRRRFILRPMPWDHPNFTGSNPNLAAARTGGYVVWTPGTDNQPGFAGVDDDGDGMVDNLDIDVDGDGVNDYSSEFGWPGSDDVLSNDAVLVQSLINAGTTVANHTLYDVDNDGDGYKDSFWIDLQLPVKTARNGRLYKPLAAFLVVDMDGRLNVNAHGNLAQTQGAFHTGDHSATGARPFAAQNGVLTVQEQHDINGDTNPDWPAHGQGYGPAEITFRHLVGNPNNRNDVARYESILLARYASQYDSTDRAPGSSGADFLAFLKAVGRPDYFAEPPSMSNGNPYGSWVNPSAFLSPPDIFGRGTVALSHAGQPIWRYTPKAGALVDTSGNNLGPASERENHPYEMNLSQPNADDSPFTPAELERVLRYRDGDAGVLANRLLSLISGGPTSLADLSKLLTTHSAYIPSPPTVPLPPDNPSVDNEVFDILFPTDLVLNTTPSQPNPLLNNAARIAVRTVDPSDTSRVIGVQGTPRMPTIVDLMAAKLVQGHLVLSTDTTDTNVPNGVNGIPNTQAGRNLLQSHLDAMLPFEFRRGQKMNPNRLWGNGEDDNGNDLVDEQYFAGGMSPYQWEVDNETIWSGSTAAGSSNYLNDDPYFAAGGGAFHPRGRELFARHLYCLLMLLVDLEYVPSTGGSPGQPQTPGFMEPFIDPTLTTNEQRRELTIRRLAQWAVNVVDFRDADSVMTPFEYDVNPWNGWNLDGNVSTDDSSDMDQFNGLAPTIPPPAEAHPERRVVWGCEHPDLLITEAFAMHDRRVKDTEHDDNDQKKRDATTDPDPTLDQYRIPQGSLFLELYCPKRNVYRNTSGPVDEYQVAPQELYNVDATGVRLDLGRLAPADPTSGLRYPVWRMTISESYRHGGDQANLHGPSELIAANKRDNVSFQPSTPDQPDEMYIVRPTTPAEIPPLPTDRIVWFAQQTPNPNSGPAFPAFEQNRVYYNRYGVTELPAGEYLVVGPRAVTHVGSQEDAPDETTPDTPSTQVFRLVNDVSGSPMPVFFYGDFGYPRRFGNGFDTNMLSDAQVKVARTIVAGADPPTAWDPDPTMLNETANLLAGTSAPPTPGVGLSVTEPLRHQYYTQPTEFLDGGAATANYPLRDSWRDIVNASGQYPDEPFDTNEANMPIDEDGIAGTARHPDYKSVFLQRLANPLLPWHPTRNPYITVDWHPIDVTVFNGEDRERGANGQWDPDDSNPNTDMDRAFDDPPFASRERLGQRVNNVNFGLWNVNNSQAHTQAEDAARSTDYFKLNARHSLGYLNRLIDADAGHPNPAAMGATDMDDFVVAPAHASVVGDPVLPFEWLVWNDRPYVSHLELMLVPASSQGRLLFEFIHRHPNVNADDSPYLPYNMPAPAPNAGAYPYRSYRAPFGHLLNFFNTTEKGAWGGSSSTRGANYYRLLDFMEVPSPFAGTEKWFNPTQIRNANAAANDVVRFRPPFSYLSRFSDPGRVNLNTIWDARVWQGITDAYPAFRGMWNTIEGTLTVNAGSSPTAYPNPLRAAASAVAAPNVPSDPLRQDPVEATLLRSTSPAATGATPRQPLFDSNNYADATTAPANAAVHPRPNAYFRYQGLQRLGNLVSGQSNVYAVWVTIGYFEVERSPAGIDREHPDGYLLGPEVGAETGEVVRHRAFYLIDRSTPVAFQPGVNHNVEKMILLRRFIE